MRYYKYSFKRKRRKKKILKIFLKIFCTIIVPFSFLIYLFFFSSFFQIKYIQTQNLKGEIEKKILEDLENQISKKFLFAKTKSIFLLDSREIQQFLLKKYSFLQTLQIKKILPDKIIVKGIFRTPIFRCCFEGNRCFLVDKKGVLFEILDKSCGFEPIHQETIFLKNCVFSPKNSILSEKAIDGLQQIKKVFLKNIKIKINSFKYDCQNKNLTVKTKEGWEAYFDLNQDISFSLVKLKMLFQKGISSKEKENLKYIDLRFSKVYYK